MRDPLALTCLLALGGALGLGCAPAPEGPLTTLDAWRVAEPTGDPFEDRPDGAGCEPFGWAIEDDVIEVETDVCDYVTLTQPLLRELAASETVSVFVWNLGTWAERPATAHVAVQIDDVRWETRPSIPSAAESWDAELPMARRVPEGTPVYLHLHNHGANSWRFAPPEAR